MQSAAVHVALVPWDSDESATMLARSKHKADFFSLANNFVSQDNAMFCGPATATIVLNALKLGKKDDLPVDKSSIASDEGQYLPKDYNPYFNKYTQQNVFSDGAKTKLQVLGKPVAVNGTEKSDGGIQLRQFATLLAGNGTDVELHVVADDLPESGIKTDMIKNLSTKGDFVIVNFARKALGQQGGGHISPIAAYDEQSDSFLMMDVNPNRASWVWVKSKDLIASMRTFDTVENRGYLLVSEAKKS
ncbi:MAG: phytochelatin synthase family protein [Pseudomonadota bacterium]